MNLNSSLKKLICFLLAMLMLVGTVGCKDKGSSTTKKKVIKKKVIVVQNDDTTDNNQDNSNTDVVVPETNTGDSNVVTTKRAERPLPEVADDGYEILDDPIVDEFSYEYQDFKLTRDYVIIYGLTEWDGRYEGYLNYGAANQTERVIEYTAENRLAANDIKTWVKDNYNMELEVYRDTEYADAVNKGILTGNEKKILVGDSAYHTSKLAENEFAVKISGDNLVFDGGHYAMVESAVDWFRSVEIKDGKVAILTSKENNFKSQIVLDGVTYDYIWGDEFDGYEFNDDEKWAQSTFGLNRQDDMANIFGDPKFQYVENGKIRLTGDRYYDEGNGAIGYATSGQIDTDSSALFRNGYFEFYARLPYRRGGFPAIWTMTADANNKNVFNYTVNDGYGIYSKRAWDLEFDLFESFADADHMTTTIHKWYKNSGITTLSTTAVALTEEEIAMVEADQAATKKGDGQWQYATPLTNTDSNGNKILATYDEDALIRYPITFNFGEGDVVDTFKYRLSPYTNMSSSMATYAYSFSYTGTKGAYTRRQDATGGTYGDWRWYFNEETINNEYHLYAFKYTSTHCTVYMDGEAFLDFDWDPAFDYKDLDGDGKGDDISRNNNGVGFNFWQYFLIDMMIYTPGNFNVDYARKIQVGDCPFNLYIDYVRFYQDLDDPSQAVHFNNGTGTY